MRHTIALRDAGLRATRPRLAVLEWLEDNPGHHGAEAVVAGTRLASATAYHVLRQLSAAGVVLTAEVGPGRVLYERMGQRHHHFVCDHCGTVADVPCAQPGTPCVQADSPAIADLRRSEVILRGRCRDCAERAAV